MIAGFQPRLVSKASTCRRSRRSMQPNLAWAAFLEFNTGHSVEGALARAAGGVKRFDWWLDAIDDSRSRHGAAHPTKLTRRRTLRRWAISRSLSRLAAKKRPNDRPFLSISIPSCQRCALLPIRSRIPASSAEILAFIENPPTPNAKICASSSIRFSIHSWRSEEPSQSNDASRRLRP